VFISSSENQVSLYEATIPSLNKEWMRLISFIIVGLCYNNHTFIDSRTERVEDGKQI
jgi:hypothetical protein